MIELRPHFPLAGLLRAACLPRSSFYFQQKALKTTDKHCALKIKSREIYDRHRGMYGYRRIGTTLTQRLPQILPPPPAFIPLAGATALPPPTEA